MFIPLPEPPKWWQYETDEEFQKALENYRASTGVDAPVVGDTAIEVVSSFISRMKELLGGE